MDAHDPDFRDSIAVDVRLMQISALLGVSFASYQEHEQFYVDIAKETGLEGWELDRLLYNFTSYFRERLTALPTGAPAVDRQA